jgi:hypothetical protein
VVISGFGVGRACGDAAVFVAILGGILAGQLKGKLRKAALEKKKALDALAAEALLNGGEMRDNEAEQGAPIVELMLLGGVLHPTCKCC